MFICVEAPKRKSFAPLALKNAYLWLSWPSLMRGYESIFQYVGIFVWEFSLEFFVGFFVLLYFGIFVWDFLWWGGFIWFPLHMTMVWYLSRGAGILAPSDAIEANINQCCEEGMGIPSSTAGPKAREHRLPSR